MFLRKVLIVSPRQGRRDRSTGVLVCIILVFFLCHMFRVGIQIYEIASPSHGLLDHFHTCTARGRLHVPAVLHVLGKQTNICHFL
jgi:hypothetical protein